MHFHKAFIQELKQKLQTELGIPVSQQRILTRTQELSRNNMTLLSYGIRNKTQLILRAPPMLKNTIGLIKQDDTLPSDSALQELIHGIQEGFNIGLVPKLTIEGTSGTYLLRNSNRKTIVKSSGIVYRLNFFSPRRYLNLWMRSLWLRIIRKDIKGSLGLKDSGKKIRFKASENNFVKKQRKGILSGEAASREIAAYLLGIVNCSDSLKSIVI